MNYRSHVFQALPDGRLERIDGAGDGFFFYESASGPRGFPLHLASFHCTQDDRPAIPSRAELESKLVNVPREQALPDKAALEVEINRRIERARLAIPAASAAYRLFPYKVVVYVSGLVGGHAHELRYQDAARFARHMGLLRHCTGCEQIKVMLDSDVTICSECGYRALDLA